MSTAFPEEVESLGGMMYGGAWGRRRTAASGRSCGKFIFQGLNI